MKRISFLIAGLILVSSIHGRAAILIEDGKATQTTKQKTYRTHSDGLSMRKVRRAGIGASANGPLGFMGANLELNFTDRWGFGGGFGGSSNYQAFTFQIKHVLAGEWLLPYLSLGYSKWYTAGSPKGPIRETTPAFLAQRFMSDREKDTGDFAVHFLYPSFGLQYVQLTGPWAGFSVFADMVLLVEIEDFESVATGTLGMMYYF
ncbi:MAG: hypothetical protein ABL958_00075 [Bdellovibrionia bacterium]